MKVYDWKTFLGSLIICGGVIAYKIISFNDILDLLFIALFAYLFFQCLKVSLTKSGYEAEQRRIKNSKELRQKMLDKYGKSAYVLMYSPFAVLIVGLWVSLSLAYASPHELLAAIIFIVTLVIYLILIMINRGLEKKLKTE